MRRGICIASGLALGSCGGLAADGRDELEPAREPGSSPAAFVEPRDRGPGMPPAPSAPGVGDACEPSSEGAERVVIGELVLEASGDCGAGHLCLMRAGVDPACALSTDSPGCAAMDRDDELVPVPPSLAPALPAPGRVCTCRCAGGGDDDCRCPEGMACRELIRSAGANGAAADFVGSYCLY